MRVIKVAAAGEEIGQKQKQAINAAIAFLKGKIPEISPMLTNPNSRAFVIKFLDLVSSDPSIMNGFKNALQTINAAMNSDASGTTVSINAGASTVG